MARRSIIIVIATGVIAAGCGSSSPKSTTSATSFGAQGLAFPKCMRTHGVPAYRDPIFPPAGGIETFDGPGVNPQSPAYQHAEAACPGG